MNRDTKCSQYGTNPGSVTDRSLLHGQSNDTVSQGTALPLTKTTRDYWRNKAGLWSNQKTGLRRTRHPRCSRSRSAAPSLKRKRLQKCESRLPLTGRRRSPAPKGTVTSPLSQSIEERPKKFARVKPPVPSPAIHTKNRFETLSGSRPKRHRTASPLRDGAKRSARASKVRRTFIQRRARQSINQVAVYGARCPTSALELQNLRVANNIEFTIKHIEFVHQGDRRYGKFNSRKLEIKYKHEFSSEAEELLSALFRYSVAKRRSWRVTGKFDPYQDVSENSANPDAPETSQPTVKSTSKRRILNPPPELVEINRCHEGYGRLQTYNIWTIKDKEYKISEMIKKIWYARSCFYREPVSAQCYGTSNTQSHLRSYTLINGKREVTGGVSMLIDKTITTDFPTTEIFSGSTGGGASGNILIVKLTPEGTKIRPISLVGYYGKSGLGSGAANRQMSIN